MPHLIYPCGCRFEITNEAYAEDVYVEDYSNHNIPVKYDIYHLPDCKETWNTFAKGNTKGVFQLEKGLGKTWSKKMQPEKLEDLAALISILRPGCLNAHFGDPPKSISQHFVDRKNKLEDVVSEIAATKDSLSKTYQLLIYQEQSISLVKDLAGFSEEEADILRRGIGKKKSDVIANLKQKFLDGCKKIGKITEEEAEIVFGWIKAGERYSFNASHGYGYSYNSYITAYLKTHFPVQFYTAYIDDAHNKTKPHEEIKELVLDAKNNGIYVSVPNLIDLSEKTYFIGNDIYLGLSSIKGMGEKAIIKLKNAVQSTDIPNTWLKYLINIYTVVKNALTISLIKSGSLDYLSMPRTKMLYEIKIFDKLSKSEITYLNTNKELIIHITDLSNLIDFILKNKKNTKPRIEVLNDLLKKLAEPPYTLKDTIDFIAKTENELLGLPITCHKSDIAPNTITCKEMLTTNVGTHILAGEITCVPYIIKRGKMTGQQMMIVSIIDSSGKLDNLSAFPGVVAKYKDLLYNGNIVSLTANCWNNRISIQKIEQA